MDLSRFGRWMMDVGGGGENSRVSRFGCRGSVIVERKGKRRVHLPNSNAALSRPFGQHPPEITRSVPFILSSISD